MSVSLEEIKEIEFPDLVAWEWRVVGSSEFMPILGKKSLVEFVNELRDVRSTNRSWYNKETIIVLNDGEFLIEKHHNNWCKQPVTVHGPYWAHYRRVD